MPTKGPTAVLLIAHGSRRAAANDDLHQLAARFLARGDHPIVEACFLELAEPDIQEGGARCVGQGAARVLMIPYFLAAGVHLQRDLTAARDALKATFPDVEFRLGPALGPHPLLDQLVAAQIARLDATESALEFSLTINLDNPYATTGLPEPHRPGAQRADLDTNGPKD